MKGDVLILRGLSLILRYLIEKNDSRSQLRIMNLVDDWESDVVDYKNSNNSR